MKQLCLGIEQQAAMIPERKKSHRVALLIPLLLARAHGTLPDHRAAGGSRAERGDLTELERLPR